MGYWTSYIGVGYSGALRPFTSDAGVMLFQPPVVVATLLVPALALGAHLLARGAGATRRSSCCSARRRGDRDGRLPRRHAAAPRRARRSTSTCSAVAVPAHDLQGGAADRARDSRCSPRPRRAAAWARLGRRRAGAARRARAPSSRARPRGRSSAARRSTRSSPGSDPAGVDRDRGRPRRSASRTRPRRSSLPGAAVRLAARGAAPSTRCCPRSPTARSPSAGSSRSPTCGRSTCSSPWTSLLQQQQARARPARPAARTARCADAGP